MSIRPKLVRYLGWLWKWWGMKDRRGWLDLQHLRHPSQGCLADPDECRILEGKEYDKQMEAVEYFENLPGIMDSSP